MEIIHKTGRYAGMQRTVQFDAARRLIESGDAVAVDYNKPQLRSERVESVSIEGNPVAVVSAKAPEPARVPVVDKSSKKKSR